MDMASFFGLLSGIIIIALFGLSGSSSAHFFNPLSLLIVIGGTFATTLLSFKSEDLKSALKAGVLVFKKDDEDPNFIIQAAIQLSKISRKQGINKLKPMQSESVLLDKVIRLITESQGRDNFESLMRIEIETLKIRHFRIQNVYRKMGSYAPAFGMLGTVIGLIKMLTQLNDLSSIGPSMAIALITTFYGSLLSTMLFIPVANKLQERTATEVMNREILLEAGMCILEEHHPIIMYDKLSAYIAPAKRQPVNLSLVN